MKRKLPKLVNAQRQYHGPHLVDAVLNVDPTNFALWALTPTVSDPIRPENAAVIRVFRTKTHEVTGSKWVEFAFAPSAVLLNGSQVYLLPEFKDARIICEWSDFLRLTRWRKQVTDHPPEKQALIAHVEYAMGLSMGCKFALRAVDHPIRKGAK